MKLIRYFAFIALTLFLIQGEFFPQERVTERGTSSFRKVGVHRGNRVRTVFSNFGVIAEPGSEGPQGAWKYDANGYVGDISPLVGLKLPVRDYGIQDPNFPGDPTKRIYDGIKDTIYSVIITPVDRPGGGESGNGKSWTFEPIPGFADAMLDEVGKGVAMSHLPETWPSDWPDHPTWTYSGNPIIKDGVDVTPKVDWNGYFGRAQFQADQESYFWMDDNNDEEWYSRYGFLPDAMDPTRKGAAIQVNVRGLQWAHFLAQDVIFWLYNIKNDGTETYDQVAFGTLVGTYVGVGAPEYNDDATYFDVRDAITYTWDFDHYISPAANPKWLPDPSAVGYIFYAFLESPGNAVDGIDNDGDDANVTINAPRFVESDFAKRTINPGDHIVLINKNTFERRDTTVSNDTMTVYSMGVPFFIDPGVTVLSEGEVNLATGLVTKNAIDGIDNDLDGLIDESYQIHYRQYKKAGATVLIDTVNEVQYKNYLTGTGLADPMIDESRDDGIDNDNDWSRDVVTGEYIYDDQGHYIDDVGADGKPHTGDAGEYDGVPTAGEPNFDATDVNESDQLGLTSFQYFVPAGDITMSDDANMWTRIRPGYYDVPSSVVHNVVTKGEDGDFIFGAGYFPLLPGKTERFSLALGFGDDLKAAIKTKKIAQTIYNANYNFPKPPDKPTLTTVPGDGKVTLYWDRVAENTLDQTLKVKDFEGYKVYKGTDPEFTDALTISDGTGQAVFYEPLYQVDLKDDISGYFLGSPALYDLTSGAPYYLGNDSGIQNFFVDNDVENGRTYYYAVVAYDRGDASKDIFPSENTKFISKDAFGKITIDINTAAVVPNAPVAGYVAPPTGEKLTRQSGFSTTTPYFEVMDPFTIEDSTYTVEFNDSLVSGVKIAYSYNIKNAGTGNYLLKNVKLTPANGVVFNGVRLSIDTTYQNLNKIEVNPGKTHWNNPDPKNLITQTSQFISSNGSIVGIKQPSSYVIRFKNEYTDSSDHLTQIFGPNAPPAKAVNFQIYDVTDPTNVKRIPFVFTEGSPFRRDTLSFLDQLTLANPEGTKATWKVRILGDSSSNIPKGGDSLYIAIYKPIAANDEFQFTTQKSDYDVISAKEQLDRIRVVPNPYVVTDVFEQPLPTTVRGRGERVINFINLPPNSTIHIYSSSGDHIRTLTHDGTLENGSVTWDVRTKEGLDVAYGVYFYVVEVAGMSDKKTGKIAIIK